MEQWRAIPGYEGLYEASNRGNIRTAVGKTTHTARHGVRRWQQRVLKQRKDKQNCMRVTLWKDGKGKSYLVARLVCAAWLENLLDTEMTVNHKDGNRLNNSVDNLEWLTRGDNIRHGFDTGLYNALMHGVELVAKGTTNSRRFSSMAAASAAIGRNNGYISLCLQRGNEVAGKDGTRYQVLRV